MGPQRRMGIYVGFDSPSIIRYLEPLTGDVFTVRYADCHFDESIFMTLGGDKLLHKINPDLTWNTSRLNTLDPRTNQCESEVQRIIHMQNIANQLPDAFSDSRHIVKSHIPAINALARVEIPIHKSVHEELINNSKPRQKRGRPISAKDVVPRKRKKIGHASEVANVPHNTLEVVSPPEEVKTPEVAVTKPQEVVFPLEEDIAPEMAHTSVKAKVPESYEISLS
ncbi:uncharacterized protein LOC141666214 [Apium graveolens]|uniref:uncharacterized protein LOC141666214 n=1 Tax=Apium graveolens TaxID=4045 RepID=UPI003D790DB9